MQVLLLAWLSLLAPSAAQVGLHRSSVASFKSHLSSGEIWKDDYGMALELNGVMMSHTKDEHVYHELLVHPGIVSAASPRRVLIIGGAEGATAREVLRHPQVQNVTMVDIDADLLDMCRVHLHAMHNGSFDSPKMRVFHANGANFIKKALRASFDVIIVDGIDFGSYGNDLFALEFYENVYRALSPGGTFTQYMSDVDRSQEVSWAGFDATINYGADIWSYAGFGARFNVASKKGDLPLEQRLFQGLEGALPSLKLSYLNTSRMRAALQHKERRLKGGGGGSGGPMPWWGWIILVVSLIGVGGFIGYKCAKKHKLGPFAESSADGSAAGAYVFGQPVDSNK